MHVVQREMGRRKRKVPSVESVNEKRHLLDAIVWRDSALAIENMFAPYSWEQFGKLKETSWIVVVGNGPVRQFHQNRIDNAEFVIRCNHYPSSAETAEGDQRLQIAAMIRSDVFLPPSYKCGFKECRFVMLACATRQRVVMQASMPS